MWRPNAKMNFWDELPSDLQNQVLQARAAATIQKNWRRHPAVRSTCLAKGIMGGEYGIEIISPWTAAALEYCATHSGHGDPSFWVNFCLDVLDKIIEEQYSSDLGHGWIERCHDAHELLVRKYATAWCPQYSNTLVNAVRGIGMASGIGYETD